ncbi:MAG: formylglycine-generating enzyme family protein [Desulfobacterales bacterium]|jgi:formylglycine-generating enzyme required for sulfatase activity|nr:formylglycine-generating enzyme family protein [Desulfobacterales bacterium]
MADIITNRIGMELMLVPAGTFIMGGDWEADQADENELPKHTVQLKKPFYIGKFAVTQSQWQAVMGQNPSHFIGSDRPVETVSHSDALVFIKKINKLERPRAYRLPTEAQWEYAARAGSHSTFCFGVDPANLPRYAWYQKNSGGETHPVGRLLPNAWGLYDMHGNVHEWCADWFDRNYYAQSPLLDPQGPKKGLARVLRGGDWGSAEPWYCRCAIRSLSSADRRSPRVGFRVAMIS